MTDLDDSPGGSLADEESTAIEEKQRLNLSVEVSSPSTCERHVVVTIPREDIEQQFDTAVAEMLPKAQVPGFRPGRAPRKLVESRFRKDLAEQVKSQLLLASLEQVQEDEKLTPISEPDFDPTAITLPDEGPMTFEFDIEVRPEFDLPNWKGLKLRRPVRQFTDADVDEYLLQAFSERGQLVPHEGPAEAGDYVVAQVSVTHDGNEVSSHGESELRVLPTLSFQDGIIANFDKLMIGAAAGDRRTAQVKLTDDAPNEALRGKTVDVHFEVLEVKRLEVDAEGGSSPHQNADFREFALRNLQLRLEYQQRRETRRQVLELLTSSADWDLPPALLQRQARREFERAVLELRRNGFSEAEIRAHANELTQNSRASTARALKEHFILERIAEELQIDAEPDDYDDEVRMIAQQSDESPRRIRAQLEKGGLMDTLRNQIIERKTVEKVLAEATFVEVPYEPAKQRIEAVEYALGGVPDPADSTPAATSES
jgi:trigger factor